MTDHPVRPVASARALSPRVRGAIGLLAILAVGGLVWSFYSHKPGQASDTVAISSQSRRVGLFVPTAAQWATLTVEPVREIVFRSEYMAEGKIAIDEDRSTPIFSPYSGRVTKLLVKPGDVVERGQPLFTVEATDMVQAQNDFIAALTALNKSRSALNLGQIVDKRQRMLYEGKAVPLKEVQQARAALDGAESDVRSNEAALQAARNRLRMLGKTDGEITEFEENGTIDPATPIFAPIGGTIVQRKVGPGQYIGTGASDPVFIIGDLSTVWLLAYIREREAPRVQVGQPVKFTMLAYPGRELSAKISYVGTGLDPGTRRLLVRAAVDNPDRLLKPEMYARASISIGEGKNAVAVPRAAVIYEGDLTRIWVARDGKSLELRPIKLGLANGDMIQVVEGLSPGDRVVTRGSLFIGRAAGT